MSNPTIGLRTEFIVESNRIEGIARAVTAAEEIEFDRFMSLEEVYLHDLVKFVSVYQPNAELRNRQGLNVRVGNHVPPPGGPEIENDLMELLADVNCENETPYVIHQRFEHLHPFTDGNGRCGRMLWAWQVKDLSLGFLHRFYYQALQHGIDEEACL